MNVVLLGASGFVGHHLVPRLARDGHRCTVLTRHAPGCRDLAVNPGTRVVQADVYDRKALERQLAGADAAINLVGILNERGRSGDGFERAHVELLRGLLEACDRVGVRRVLQMSALNAGEGKSHYLRTKGEAEDLLKSAEGVRWTIFQPSVIFGPGDSFFNRFATLLRFSPVLPLACPNAKMQPVYVRDVVEAFARSLGDPATQGRTYPLVGPDQWRFIELVRWTAGVLGLRRWVVGLPDPVSRLQATVMDFVPGKPFSTDNYRSLQVDNVSGRNGLDAFGIQPHSVEGAVPAYLPGSLRQRRLQRYRKSARR
ncbi:MAG: complex I NDUFA9 subunit family protein [Xanthomonadales bacterium]|nr:complex I NDUFA9 subunit family protein [Xanthomonadales bacterium]